MAKYLKVPKNYDLSIEQYEFIKNYNKSLNLKSKEDYVIKKDINKYYIEKPDEYFKNNGVWVNWYDFICYDTKDFLKTKDEWIKFCKDNLVKSVDDYDKLCIKFKELLPINPDDFYRGFTNITYELKLYNNIRR